MLGRWQLKPNGKITTINGVLHQEQCDIFLERDDIVKLDCCYILVFFLVWSGGLIFLS